MRTQELKQEGKCIVSCNWTVYTAKPCTWWDCKNCLFHSWNIIERKVKFRIVFLGHLGAKYYHYLTRHVQCQPNDKQHMSHYMTNVPFGDSVITIHIETQFRLKSFTQPCSQVTFKHILSDLCLGSLLNGLGWEWGQVPRIKPLLKYPH